MSKQVIFLDKDGALLKDVADKVDIRQIELKSGVIQGLKRLMKAGFNFIIVSNQSGVAHGSFSERAVRRVKRYLKRIFEQHDLALLDFYYCPHHPRASIRKYKKAKCSCRKPAPGLLWEAKDKYNIDLRNSWFIGDILDDVECGQRAGCNTVMIDNGHETEWEVTPLRKPDAMVSDLKEAANFILESISPPTLCKIS